MEYGVDPHSSGVSWFKEDESCGICVPKNVLNPLGLQSVYVGGNLVVVSEFGEVAAVSGKPEQEVGVATERGVGVVILDVQDGVHVM